MARDRHGLSERRACRIVGQSRSTQRYKRRERDDEKPLRSAILAAAKAHPRYGSRRIRVIVRGKGFRVNQKRVARIWREEGLQVPVKKRKRRRLGQSANGCSQYSAQLPNHVWSYDFVGDQTEDGRTLKILPVLDEFTRRDLALECGRSFTSGDVIETLERLVKRYGAPVFLRSDNGPEFIAAAIRNWLADSGIGTLFVAPASPWENGYSESFNSRLRDELLDRELFTSLTEARYLLDEYRQGHNELRPHSSLGYRTPERFYQEWLEVHGPAETPLPCKGPLAPLASPIPEV
jgi:transposase InsO family protein